MNQSAMKHQFQRGFSLVELMIAITLGLVLIAAVGSIYLGSSQSYRTQTGISQVQEGGRFATLLITPIVRLAGYLPNGLTQTDPTAIFKASNNKLAVYGFNQTVAATAIGSNYPGLVAANVVAGSEVIAVSYEGKNDTAPADVKLKTCLGRDVDSLHVAVNVYFISDDGNGVHSLSCYDNITLEADATTVATASTSVQPLVAGVTDMQILYGVDTTSGNNTNATQYMTSAQVTAGNYWTKIASVQITLTVDSVDATEKSRSDTVTPTGVTTLADGVTGGKIRHTFITVLNIRNRLGA